MRVSFKSRRADFFCHIQSNGSVLDTQILLVTPDLNLFQKTGITELLNFFWEDLYDAKPAFDFVSTAFSLVVQT
jgi:hypothetical protein